MVEKYFGTILDNNDATPEPDSASVRWLGWCRNGWSADGETCYDGLEMMEADPKTFRSEQDRQD